MKVLVLNVEDGTSRICEETDISEEDLQMVDTGSFDIIKAVVDTHKVGDTPITQVVGYRRATVEREGENVVLGEWMSL